MIGCSAWRLKRIQGIRFEHDFQGQSLAEDVIFSVKAGRKGILITDPNIILSHDESEIGRPLAKEHWKMWMQNRWRLIKVMNGGPAGVIAYWWSAIGQAAILIISQVKSPSREPSGVFGIVQGALTLRKRSSEN